MFYNVGYKLLIGINYFFRILNLVLLLYCVLSFFGRNTKLYATLDRFLMPLRRPFMPISMRLAQMGLPLDFSIIFLWIALGLVQRLLTEIIYMLMGLW